MGRSVCMSVRLFTVSYKRPLLLNQWNAFKISSQETFLKPRAQWIVRNFVMVDTYNICRGQILQHAPKYISSGHKGYDTLKIIWRLGHNREKHIYRGYVVGVS